VGGQLEFGVYIPQVAFSFDEVLARAMLCEELGIGSFWLFDHLYGPGMPGQDSFEGWTLATAVLSRTTALRVGHLVLDNNLRHPVLLGKMATTLDVISNGRLDIGIGSGSYEAEHRQGGFPWGRLSERSARLGETLEILTSMFRNDETTFAGTHFQVAGIPNRPRPVQQPGPPIHIGGIGARFTLPLVARYADVWNVPTYGLARFTEAVPVLAAECERVGRDPASLRRSIEAVLVLCPDQPALTRAREWVGRRYGGPGWGLEEGGFIGTPAAVIDRIGTFAEQGVSQFVFFVHDRGERETLALLAEEVIGQFR